MKKIIPSILFLLCISNFILCSDDKDPQLALQLARIQKLNERRARAGVAGLSIHIPKKAISSSTLVLEHAPIKTYPTPLPYPRRKQESFSFHESHTACLDTVLRTDTTFHLPPPPPQPCLNYNIHLPPHPSAFIGNIHFSALPPRPPVRLYGASFDTRQVAPAPAGRKPLNPDAKPFIPAQATEPDEYLWISPKGTIKSMLLTPYPLSAEPLLDSPHRFPINPSDLDSDVSGSTPKS